MRESEAMPTEPKTKAPKKAQKKPKTGKKAKPPKRRAAKEKAPPEAKAPEETPEEAPEVPAPRPGQVRVYSLEGEPLKNVDLPPVFRSEVRVDLIRRAVTASRANRRQTYGPAPRAGMRHSVRWSGKGHGVSRVPRIRGTMIGAQAPGTVGGRQAHPPHPGRIWAKKINQRERRLARNAAVAALRSPELVSGRGHRFEPELSLPVVLEDRLEALEPKAGAAREGTEILRRVGLLPDVLRAKEGRHVRAGRGKMRGRRYRQAKSLLVVVKDPWSVRRALGNLPGVDIASPAALNAELLAPGGDPGRLAVFSEGALEVLRSWSP